MGLIQDDTFVCFDCEATGLDPRKDEIIEIAAAKFTFNQILDSREDLIEPTCSIPQHTIEIHHITDEMVRGKPKIQDVLAEYLEFFSGHVIIGHGIPFDIAIVEAAAQKFRIPSKLSKLPFIDTLRLARLYGESPTNSLEMLRSHFNIKPHGAHRAMNDVHVNIEVFKHLSSKFKTTQEVLKRLERPIQLKAMPLGKHKGRPFKEIPSEYLQWAAKQNFDQDLLFSVRSELKKRKTGKSFGQASNPFSGL
ncbi:putative quorum-sensing-regulated virulence factor [Simkania sp.]|uniref:putative quorum-sensing-regulated virulence factor n=1 Tax=Simkania sp. TaxID=34094 RepID=UPI003B51B365